MVLLWTTYRLPYERDIRAQFQCQREYLGHLLSSILVTTYKRVTNNKECTYYKWINDNTGALQKKYASRKCDSEASLYACLAVKQLHQCSKIEVVDTTHKAGVHMGNIDTMSRFMDNENPIKSPASTRFPSLKPDKYWHCQDIPEIKTLF